jgi:iron complex outermembrane receptor protein
MNFQVGVGTASYKVNQVADLAPSINNGWETGIKFKPRPWLEGRVALWTQTASNEARRKLNDPANDSENIGETERKGIDFEINGRPNRNWSFWASAAFQKSKILRADASAPATQGKEIDHVPKHLFNAGIDYRVNDALSFGASINGQSNYFLERSNSTGSYGGYVLSNLSASYRFSSTLSAQLQVRNLTNRYYEYVWYDGVQSLHAPGAPRSVYLSLAMGF